MTTKPRTRPKKEELVGLSQREQDELYTRYWRKYQSWYRVKRHQDPEKRSHDKARMRDYYHKKKNDPEGYAKIQEARHKAELARGPRIHAQRRKLPKHIAKDRALKTTFGITLKEFNVILGSQGGLCAMCRKPETHMKYGRVCALSVDHDHETGKIRGLLCNSCNRGLGFLKDNPETLASGVEYLKK